MAKLYCLPRNWRWHCRPLVNPPIAEKIAEKLIQKYQTSSCQQLAQEKQQAPAGEKSAMEQKVIEALHKDPQLRKHFLEVAGPIVNKLFECGFIP